MSLVIRYVYKAVVKENFIALIDCHAYVYNTDTEKNFEPKLNGEVLGDVVISLLQKFDLDLKYYVGIGTDGCSVMVSLVRGAVQKIQSYAKNAIAHVQIMH